MAEANTEERIARLERENRELREQVNAQLPNAPEAPPSSTGCLSQVGLVVIAGFVALVVFWAMCLYPPWVKVKSQRHQGLYLSTWVKDYESYFAGYDSWDSPAKKQVVKPNIITSGSHFDITEYRIYWPLIWMEWAIICGLLVVGVRYGFRSRAGSYGKKRNDQIDLKTG